MTRRKAYVPRKPFRFENPEAFPAWVYIRPPGEAAVLRGGPVFDVMADMGLRVQRLEQQGDDEVVQVVFGYRPWTFVFCTVPYAPWPAEVLANEYCSVIMDCHFPIMDMGQVTGDDGTIIEIIDRKDDLLANLALAEVVTVPHPTWAADLAEVNPNVFVLPDLHEDEDRGGVRFISRLSAAASLSGQVKQARWRARGEMGL